MSFPTTEPAMILKEVLFREVDSGALIPRGYGVAWSRFDRDSFVCAPIPLNRLLSHGRAVLFWFMGYRQTWVDRLVREAEARGRAEGHAQAIREYGPDFADEWFKKGVKHEQQEAQFRALIREAQTLVRNARELMPE